MSDSSNIPRHAVAICGGAIAGSEAAAFFAERGVMVLVLEQNDRPYGKIEDGLPRWHEALRKQECERINENLSKPNVWFVPRTKVGRDISLRDLASKVGLNAVILANGAWRDRPLSIQQLDAAEKAGLVYQNSFVYWFNHYHELDYKGPRYEVADGAIVIGGGLASIDVVKIINLELYAKALRARGIEVNMLDLELKGIPTILEQYGLNPESLGIKGCTLFYRRRSQDMPLTPGQDATPEQQKKLEVARAKILEKLMRKYLVRFEPCASPVEPLIENGRLTGMKFRRTEVVDGKLRELPGSEFDVHAPLIVSSVGSVPEPIHEVPMKGELYSFSRPTTGELAGWSEVFGLGNVLTGRGNIKASRHNAQEIAASVIENYLGIGSAKRDLQSLSGATHEAARAEVEAISERVEHLPKLSPANIQQTKNWIETRWNAVGYPKDYMTWIRRVTPKELLPE